MANAEYDDGKFECEFGASALAGGSVGVKIGKAMPEVNIEELPNISAMNGSR